MFREKFPVAWQFHRSTSRWRHSRLEYHPERRQTPAFKEYLDLPLIPLPDTPFPKTSFVELVHLRASCRRFTPGSIPLAQISGLLLAGYGALDRIVFGSLEQVNRPVPSGGGLYPLEIYTLILHSNEIDPGLYHFNALHHGLEPIRQGELPKQFLTELFMNQPYVSDASCLLVIAAVVDRSLWKYEDRGYRYILFEAGHVTQNFNLAAAVFGLGSLNLGGFFDLDLAEFLQLDPEVEVPLYVTAVGIPETADVVLRREPREGFPAF